MSEVTLKQKVTKFLTDKKNANYLVDILACLESSDSKTLTSSIKGVEKIFCHLITSKAMYFSLDPSLIQDPSGDEQYKIWLRQRYTDARDSLVKLLVHSDSQIQEMSLGVLMRYIRAEAQTPLQPLKTDHMPFPSTSFKKILLQLVQAKSEVQNMFERMREYMIYDDVRYVTMKTIVTFLEQQGELSVVSASNMISLLENLCIPTEKAHDSKEDLLEKLSGTRKKRKMEDESSEAPPAKVAHVQQGEGQKEPALANCFGYQPDAAVAGKMLKVAVHRKLYTSCWLALLKKKLDSSQLRRVLTQLPDKVMPHMHNPLPLADYLTQAYNYGGAISLLALSGLFRLIHKHNLQYPDFYDKLYSLLTPSLLHVKFKDRFFHLLDYSLHSTHLPSYLSAAFVKRLCRLTLAAPVHVLPLLCGLALNLLRRFPACRALLHSTDTMQLTSDPFDNEERDPSKSKALESSLWELKTLQQHWYAPVASQLERLDEELSIIEVDISELLESTQHELLVKETKKSYKDPPLTYLIPKSLRQERPDELSEFWDWN